MQDFIKRMNYKFVFFLFIIYYIPWVFVLHSGLLIYFPYDETGKSRYIKVIGPAAKKLFGSDWSNTKEIPKICKYAIIQAEDSEFLNHHGIHWSSILSSIKENNRRGKIISGASTLTQQLVKNAFLSRDKNYFRKSREIIGALFLNLIYSKDSQLTWYLNVVEFGPRIYGIDKAAKFYFQKNVSELTRRDCVVLATFLTRPVYYGNSYKSGQLPLGFQRRFHRIYVAVSN